MKWYQKMLAGSAGVTGAGLVAWKTMFPWLEYDLQLMAVGKRITKLRELALQSFLIDKFEEKVAQTPKKPFIIFEDNVYTYEFMDQMACKVANVAKSLGLGPRDCIAMMIENEPSFVWTFLGFQKLGVAVAFINYNLKMHPLVHSVLAADPKYLIVGSGDQLVHSVLEVLDDFGKLPVYVQGLGSAPVPHGLHSFDALMSQALPTGVSPAVRADMTLHDICCYIYTSGTTGNPKPAMISQAKCAAFGLVLALIGLCTSDVLYTVLPIYHSAGGGIGLCGVIDTGNPKPVMISQGKSGAFGDVLALIGLCTSDVLYTVLPIYHSAGGGIGLCGVIKTGYPKPALIKQQKASINCCVTQCVALCPTDILYMVLPLYHSAGGGTGMFGVLYQGAPKPVYISQAKAIDFSGLLYNVEFQPSDVLYIVLPLYHTSGGGTGLMNTISRGATMVLRRKFSARYFFEDCRKHNVTVIQYIGELFRYLLAQPASPLDSQHSIRAAFGNGLRKDIWVEVNNRFKIPHVVEFFGATEGTTMLVNIAGKPGAIGRLSPLINALDPDPKALVKFDYETALPLRDKNGHCMKVGVGEPGLFISRVPEALMRDGTLKVYRSSDEANEKKLVRNAFVPGDLYFNFGDVFVLDNEYFLYFQDRIGDTFRWKGENVSTTELANVITALPFIEDANVYGVTMPGSDGRAGMAAITANPGTTISGKELKELYDHVCEELPSYARPLFIRYLNQAVLTGTFKQRKVELVKEGYDLSLVKDPLFFLDNITKTYSPLREQDLAKFLSSKL